MITDERTGSPLIRRVLRTRDLYAGEHLDILPDLLVEWDGAAATGNTRVGSGTAAPSGNYRKPRSFQSE